MTPQVIGDRYRVKSAIGRGGMGTVWLCTDEILGRDVAVKQVGVLPGESATDSARALREARSSAALNHRSVVSVFDVTEANGSLWMVMEYVPSRTLAQVVREDGPLPPRRVAAIGAQVADGLAVAHAAGTIHRDVKPANILLAEDGTAKIGDFGIARMHGDQALTQTGFVTGTPSYFSPELASGHDPGPPTDVWALGATLFTAVEGSPPYAPQRNPVAMLHTIATQPAAEPRNAGPLEEPLRRMMDRDPATRWSMAEAARALRRLADGEDPEPPPSPATTVLPAASPSPARDRRRAGPLPLLAVLVALLLVAGLGLLLLGRHADRGRGTASGAASSSSTPSSSPAASPSASSSASASSSPSSASPRNARAASPRTALRSFLRGYYATVPGNLDAGWAKLGPHEQAQGRASYQRFWGSVRRVDAASIQAQPASSSAELTLTYHFRDGRVVVERQRLGLVRSGHDGWLIDDDTVLSSRTVRG